MSKTARATDSSLVTLLGLIIGLPMAAGFVALVIHAFSTGLNSMVATLPTWVLIGAFGCAALGAYKGWKARSVERLRLYGLVLAGMTFVLGGSMMFMGNTPAGSEVEVRVTGMFNLLPALFAWFCVFSCVVLAFLPIENAAGDN